MMADTNLNKKLTGIPKITSIGATPEKHVQFRWAKINLAEVYDIQRSTRHDCDFEYIDSTTDLCFTDTTVEENITYWYKVIAHKRLEGDKISSVFGTAKPVTVSDIPAVKNLRAEEKGGKIHITWDKVEGDKFYIYRRSDFFSRKICIGESESCCFCDEHPVSGQAYHYAVQAVKLADDKELHGKFSGEADCVFIDTTEIRSIKKIIGKKALITVRVVAGVDGYIFERCDKKGGEFTEIGRTEGTTEVKFEDKLSGRFASYSYRVCAYKKVGKKEFRGKYSEVKHL